MSMEEVGNIYTSQF